jgi:hypothetical protein
MLAAFPNLAAEDHSVTSPSDSNYNCIAWAADQTDRWWWPDPFELYFWPADVPRVETLDTFVEAFRKQGYERCANADLETGFEKIAIYAKGKPTHAARQLPDGQWTSKLGQSCDIRHQSLHGVEGELYGSAVVFLKRSIIRATG